MATQRRNVRLAEAIILTLRGVTLHERNKETPLYLVGVKFSLKYLFLHLMTDCKQVAKTP